MKTKTILSLLSAFILHAAPAFAMAPAAFEVQSNLKNGQSVPADYYAGSFGCNAKSVSPSLAWKNVPAGTKSFAITLHDEDAPTGSGFWHYVAFDIPATTRRVEIGDLTAGRLPAGSVESMTDAGTPGFFGPCPPAGRKHRYLYTVHALKVEKLGVPPTATPAYVGFNLWMNSLGKASFFVTAGPRK